MGAIKQVVDEPGARSPQDYARRVLGLAVLYPLVTLASLAGEALLVWRVKALVTLTQRSNVETLTLAFFAVYFAYVGFLGARGVKGGLTILTWRLRARLRGHERNERSKHASLGPGSGDGPIVALNVVVERAGLEGRPFALRIGDDFGTVGAIEVDGARIRDAPERRDGSSNLLAYFAHQVGAVAGERQGREVDVVAWGRLDDEGTHQFLALVDFGRNLGAALEKPGLWPRVVLDDAECAELERRLSAVCPALREEALLPQWEYEAEHKLPIVPEPLGLASLGRTERRADPLPTLSSLTLVVLVVVAILVTVLAAPPWIPGK
ncbi:MAG TPA: hypothetical protein VFK85_09015 [Anaeromyxobacteraceae bacterium]|nr:hypothetical protein [Anaeromyxobacteraceae bacterium]